MRSEGFRLVNSVQLRTRSRGALERDMAARHGPGCLRAGVLGGAVSVLRLSLAEHGSSRVGSCRRQLAPGLLSWCRPVKGLSIARSAPRAESQRGVDCHAADHHDCHS